ncbi:MAG: RraA family protein [Dehalococcoidia bacterium]
MDANLEAFKTLPVSGVSDALDRLGLMGQCFGIKPIDRSFKIAGRAFTVRTVPVAAGTKGASVGDYIDDVPAGEVVVLDNAGRLDGTVWGDILTIMAHRRDLGGTVIHGVCRDSSRSLELGYPIFSRGTYMRTGKDRVQADGYSVPASLGDVRVMPGDLMLGDADGVVVVPRGREDEILAVTKEIDEAEERIRQEIETGSRLDEARKKFRYFQLQSRV